MTALRNTSDRRRNLLVEIGVEELPPRSIKKLAEAFSESFAENLAAAGVIRADTERKWFASPRRLAVWVQGVARKQPERMEQRKGPALSAAFDAQGRPTRAALGFAKSCGVALEHLQRAGEPGSEHLLHEKSIKGKNLETLVTEALAFSVRRLPVAKRMRWGARAAEFVRPAHWLLVLYGSDTLKTQVLELKADRFTRGHRVHCPGNINILSADHYLETLRKTGFVVADYDARKALIERQVTRLAKKSGACVLMPDALLDEVTGLVEWPVSLQGEFDSRFLALPEEVLVSTMQSHQKYFCLTDSKGRLMAKFITVGNIRSKAPKRVREGNERVLRARLADAEFFWKADQKKPLVDRVEDLRGVLFHQQLGSVWDKMQRIHAVAQTIAQQIGADVDLVATAARLCKADLVTDMVGEFPELQGTIGGYYAARQGVAKPAARAIGEHYLPRFSGDRLPGDGVSQSIALVDRLDSLVGIFACAEAPTGDKDPYALRRAALASVRILIAGKLPLDLHDLIALAAAELKKKHTDLPGLSSLQDDVFIFMAERMRSYFYQQGYSADEFSAIASTGCSQPLDFQNRIRAVRSFFDKRAAAAVSLAATNKRIANIMDKNPVAAEQKIAKRLIRQPAEVVLYNTLDEISGAVRDACKSTDYEKGLKLLASLKHPIDRFFDEVMVMDEDPALRGNRLAMLAQIRQLFSGIADFSKIRIR